MRVWKGYWKIMGQIVITIDKREYAITCDDGQEGHIMQLSRVLDGKAKQLAGSLGPVNENMMLAMVGLLLADELQDMQKGCGVVSQELLQKQDAEVAQTIDSESEKIRKLIKEVKPL